MCFAEFAEVAAHSVTEGLGTTRPLWYWGEATVDYKRLIEAPLKEIAVGRVDHDPYLAVIESKALLGLGDCCRKVAEQGVASRSRRRAWPLT